MIQSKNQTHLVGKSEWVSEQFLTITSVQNGTDLLKSLTIWTWFMASCFRFWFRVTLRSPLLARSRPAADCTPLLYASKQYLSSDSNRLDGTHSSSRRLPGHTQEPTTITISNCNSGRDFSIPGLQDVRF